MSVECSPLTFKPDVLNKPNFITWFGSTSPNFSVDSDPISEAIKDDIWPDPLALYYGSLLGMPPGGWRAAAVVVLPAGWPPHVNFF